MTKQILELAAKSTYDFRVTANPEDSMRYLFDEWVPYYRMKWAIARVLEPKRILEIGVRHGYSAAAFLDGAPGAAYLGIDNDSNTFGGERGAIHWARQITPLDRAEFLLGDSQTMAEFPGGRYDLIHLDGQQYGEGSIRDLKKAILQAKHILVDGYFWTRDNFLHVSEFLFQYRDLIESCVIIPGYAGELLITPILREFMPASAETSEGLRDAYSTSYYLRDCGGFDAFKQSKAGILRDVRLKSVADLAQMVPPGRALDLGCGRGELSLRLAREGHQVVSIDYSQSAIDLAQEAARTAACNSKIDYYCGSVNAAPLAGKYDLAVASDLIEHMTREELDLLYQRVAAHLTADGIFVVHTFPNAWYYKYSYPRRVRKARALGAYLPAESRSRYEELMHINEQNPRVLRGQLKAHFGNVLLWFADHGLTHPFDNLGRRFSRAEMRDAGDLFAIASHSPVDLERLRGLLEMHHLAADADVEIRVVDIPESVKAGQSFEALVRLSNRGDIDFKSRLPNPVHLAFHCYSPDNETLVFDGVRTGIPLLRAGAVIETPMHLQAPEVRGMLRFRVTLVQESIAWFDSPPRNVFEDRFIRVE
jgi:SAM-dependent methyltransferase